MCSATKTQLYPHCDSRFFHHQKPHLAKTNINSELRFHQPARRRFRRHLCISMFPDNTDIEDYTAGDLYVHNYHQSLWPCV